MEVKDVLNLVNADEFLDRLPQDPRWSIEPLVLEGGILMLHAREGVGKSSIAVQLSHSFITGDPWIGFDVPETGPVIYLNLDMAELEMGRLIRRGRDEGFKLNHDFYLPPLDEGFNVLNDEHYAVLEEYCRRIQPSLVVLDTADDGYRSQNPSNEVIREVLKRYRRAVSPALFLFLQHERKKSKPSWSGEEQDDPDAYLGFGAWSRVATCRLQLKQKDGSHHLIVRKSRVEKPGFKELKLAKTEHGFFELLAQSQQMLRIWPNNVPPNERIDLVDGIEHKSEVFRDIANRTGTKQATVRKQYNRAKQDGATFDWENLLEL